MANQSQFWFAWIDSSETVFGPEHQVEDQLIFSFKLTHEEGQFAQLELEILNPHIGFFAPGRPFWAWFSYSDGTTVTPLFRGRVVGIPGDLFAEIVTITLVAKPKDYTEQILALSATLKVLPFYDPIFIDQTQQDNQDSVLEGYSKLWHVDPVTHVVTVSDVIAGEDGVVEFAPDDAFYDSLKISISGSPLLVCEIDATVTWTQCDSRGSLGVATASGITGDANLGGGFNVTSGLSAPLTTASLSTVGAADPYKQTTYSWNYSNHDSQHNDGDMLSQSGSITVPFFGGQLTSQSISFTPENQDSGTGEEYSINQSFETTFPGVPTAADATPANDTSNNLQIGTEVEQSRTEILHVRVTADVQPVLSEATEQDSIKTKLTMNGSDVVAANAVKPTAGVYFPTARGLKSLEYILMVARANLLTGSRVVATSWTSFFSKVVGLSCRKNATIEDTRLPGGIVLGKVVLYELTGNGDSGEFLGNVTIHSAVGFGNSIVLADGTPDYVDVGYVDPGYQHYTGQFVSATTQDLTFTPLYHVNVGIQLPISSDQILVRHEYHDAGQVQAVQQVTAASQTKYFNPPIISGGAPTSPPPDAIAYSNTQFATQQAVLRAVNDHPTWIEIELAPIQKISTDVEYDAIVAPLIVPKQIDLSAPSSP